MDKWPTGAAPAQGRGRATAPLVLDRGARPLHAQIADELRRQIRAGELRPGELLPSEGRLLARFGVSRGTVRQALAALRAEGLVAGSRGRPPVVCSPRLTQPFGDLLSFSSWVRGLGMRPSGAVVEFGPGPATAEEAAALGLEPGSTVYRLVRVRFADDEALMIERSTFPPTVGERVARLDLARQSIYQELARQGVVFASARHLIDAVPASAADARLLRVSPRSPLLRVRRHAFAPGGEPLEWSEDRYLASRVAFAIDNTARDSAVVRRLDRTGARSSMRQDRPAVLSDQPGRRGQQGE